MVNTQPARMFLLVPLLWGIVDRTGGERHSLTYIYTGLSKPVGLPGIHEFTAMGLLDGKMIDYFDSDTRVRVPRQNWMKERLFPEYWEKGTMSRQSKQQWFKVNIDILMQRMRQNESDVHVLQWMHGCEANVQPDGTIKFLRSMHNYNFDGEDFLTFDDANGVWVTTNPAAESTKRKWNSIMILKEYTKGYLENECMDWLNKFRDFWHMEVKAASPPDLFVFASNAKVESNIVLTCLATGFHSKNIILEIGRDHRVLTKEDGVESSGVRPNEDDTFQRRDHVEVLRSDKSTFTCRVVHAATSVNVEAVWDHSLPDGPGGVIAGGVVTLLLSGVGILVVLWKRGTLGKKPGVEEQDDASSASRDASQPVNGPAPAAAETQLHDDPPPANEEEIQPLSDDNSSRTDTPTASSSPPESET